MNSTTGILLWETNHSTVYQSILLNNTVGLNVTESFNNTIHNNYFNNTINIEERNLAPVQINHFNISKTCSDSFVNIIGGNCTGGNFYSDYTGWDTSPDGVGDTQTPHNSTANIHRSEGDHLPLTSFKQISCGNITADLTLPQSFTEGTNTNDACFTVTTDNITLDCQGYNINGNSSGSAFNITNRQNVTIKDCNINGFEYAIYAENTNISNITNLTITNSTQAIYAITAQNNSITTNTIKNTSVALNLTNSENNTIHNNFINATTLSVWDNGTNWYNISRTCSDNYTNILGHNCTGGNFWADYVGTDNGNGSGTFNATPWNISGDGVGDNELPFNASNNISVNHIGDYLPLLTITSSSSSSSSSGGSSGSSSSGGGGGGSSGGSSGGGGGGGSSSSSSSDTTDTEDTTCTESWICPAWTECENGQQTRTCADENDCGTYNSRPDETRECESEEPAPEPVEEPAPEESHPIIDFITLPSPARTFTITSIALLAGLGTVFGYWEFIKPSARLRRRLRKAQSIVGDESTDALKEHYKGIYKLYMKTSEKNKQNFYANVTKLREHIEEGLKAERLIQKQFESAQNAPDLLSQKKSYLKIYKEYQKLPAKTQEKYYHKIVDLRARLESGA